MTFKFNDSQLKKLRTNYARFENQPAGMAAIKPVVAIVCPAASRYFFLSPGPKRHFRPALMWIAYAAKKEKPNAFMGIMQSAEEVTTLDWFDLSPDNMISLSRSDDPFVEMLDLAEDSACLEEAYSGIGIVRPGYVDGKGTLVIEARNFSETGPKELFLQSGAVGEGLFRPTLIVA